MAIMLVLVSAAVMVLTPLSVGDSSHLTTFALADIIAECERTPLETTHSVAPSKIDKGPTQIPPLKFIGNIKCSAYNATKAQCGKSDGITASGKKASWSTVAVSRDLERKGLSPGTCIYIKGVGHRVIEDRMAHKNKRGKVIKNTIDVFIPGPTKDAYRKAVKFGSKPREVYLVRK